MSVLRSLWRMLVLTGLILYGCAQLVVRRPKTRAERAMWLHQLCRRAIEMFGIDLRVQGAFPERGVLISNHLSYLDIIVFAAVAPCVFVSKAEIEGWPVLGWMTTMSGTVYVRRGRGGSAKEAGGEMRAAADAGLPVIFFPEGTTSNGETILKFHSGLLAEAVCAEQPVTVACLRYSLAAGNGDATASDEVAWWGDRALVAHVFRFLSLRGVRAEVTIAPEPLRFRLGSAKKRKLLGVEARDAVCELRGGCAAAVEDSEAVGSR